MRHKPGRSRIPSPSDWVIFFYALFLLPVTAFLVRRFRFKDLLNWMDSKIPQGGGIDQQREPAVQQAHRVTRLFLRALYYSPIKGKCLSQSLVLWHLLKRKGIQSELRIGVRKKDDRLSLATDNFDAHAWVEFQGEVLNDRPDVYENFAVINHSF